MRDPDSHEATLNGYLELLRVPHVAPLLAASVLARLPIGINALALVLFLSAERGSFALAGAVTGALSLGLALGAPLQGRLVDRRGPGMLITLGALHAAGLTALVLLGKGGAPAAALLLTALATGVAVPPAGPVLRARYPALLRERAGLLPAAYALDSIVTQLLFIGGPLLTAVLVTLVDAAAALLLSATAVVAGAASMTAALPALERGPIRPVRGFLGALDSPGIRTLALSMLPVGFAFGSVEVALPAFASQEGRRELAGVLLALWALGSAGGGLVYGARPRRSPLATVHLRVAALLPLGLLPLAIAPSLAAIALLVVPAGALIAPLIATRNELAGTVAPPGAETEAYTWPLTALVGGISLGATVAGALADGPGWRIAVLAAAASAAVGASVIAARRRTLRDRRASLVATASG